MQGKPADEGTLTVGGTVGLDMCMRRGDMQWYAGRCVHVTCTSRDVLGCRVGSTRHAHENGARRGNMREGGGERRVEGCALEETMIFLNDAL